MNIAVFGASGFIGSHLIKQAIIQGHNVLAFAGKNLGERHCCSILPSDLSGGDQIHFPHEIDALFYLAQSAYYRDFPTQAENLFAVNAFGPVRTAKAALAAGCRFFFYASSGSVYTPSFAPLSENSPTCHHTPYAASKLMGEIATGCFDDSMVVMNGRIFGAYGPEQKTMLPWMLLQKICRDEPIELMHAHDVCDGGLRISFIYVEDLVKRLLILAELALSGATLPTVLNLAGPESVSIKDFALAIGRVLAKQVQFANSEKVRTFDLYADISVLNSICPLSFTPLESGVFNMCNKKIFSVEV